MISDGLQPGEVIAIARIAYPSCIGRIFPARKESIMDVVFDILAAIVLIARIAYKLSR
jgi:hypothetical protein